MGGFRCIYGDRMTQPAPIKEPIAEVSRYITRPWLRWFQIIQSAVSSSTSIVNSSTYAISITDSVLFFDTDSMAITASLPAGTDEIDLTCKNVGSSGNNVTLTPSGAETIEENTIYDGESFHLRWSFTQGWRVV